MHLIRLMQMYRRSRSLMREEEIRLMPAPQPRPRLRSASIESPSTDDTSISVSEEWKRPSSCNVGRVWARFSAIRQFPNSTSRFFRRREKYIIRDLRKKDFNNCIQFLQRYLLNEELLFKELGVGEDAESLQTLKNNFQYYTGQKLTLACFRVVAGKPRTLVAINILMVKTKQHSATAEDLSEVKGEPWRKLLGILLEMEKRVDIFSHFNIDKYLISCGLTVHPSHRGLNIGQRMIEVRKKMCEMFELPVAVAIFTEKKAQDLGIRCGYQEVDMLSYEDIAKKGIDLRGRGSDGIKMMAIRFDNVMSISDSSSSGT